MNEAEYLMKSYGDQVGCLSIEAVGWGGLHFPRSP